MKNQLMQCVWAVCLTVAPGHCLWSQSSLYFDRGSFINACQAVPGNQQSISYFPSLGGLIGPALTISDVTFRGRYLATAPNGFLYNFDSGVPLSIEFANGARAFGGDFSSFLSPLFSSFTATLSLDNGETFTFTAPTSAAASSNSRFFGFISPTPFRSLTFSDGGLFPNPNIGHQELIGNLYMVTVPEPHTLGLLGLGALVLGWRVFKKRRQ